MWFKLFLLTLFGINFTGFSQKNWQMQWSVPIDSNAVWDIDNIRYCYIFTNQTFRKIDVNGKTILQESYKSLGDITKIDAQNPLKIACFSEGQQSICFLDNALAVQNDCVDLNDLNVDLATGFSASLQTDRIWVYDEPNSKLLIITLRTGQSQVSQNVKSLLELGIVTDIQEIDNRLFLFDDHNQVAWFDMYGNFMDYTQLPESAFIYPLKNNFLVGNQREIIAYDVNGQKIELFWKDPTPGTEFIRKIKIEGDCLYVQTKSTLTCYRLIEK